MLHLVYLPMLYSSIILSLSQACLLYFATNDPPCQEPLIPYPDQAPPSASVPDRTMLNVASTQELENAITANVTVPTRPGQANRAAPQSKEEVAQTAPQPKEGVDAAPQHKEEVGDNVDDNSPEICLSHLPATEEVGGQLTPSRVLADKSLAVEAPALIS